MFLITGAPQGSKAEILSTVYVIGAVRYVFLQCPQHQAAPEGQRAAIEHLGCRRLLIRFLSQSLNDPRFLYAALMGQWRYSLHADKLTATMQIAERVYSLAQEQYDAALMIGAYRSLAVTLLYLGDFESARQSPTA
jgi:hypothetical protein